MNFRQHHSKQFGNRGSDLPNPWMTDDELLNMRRQNPQFHSPVQNMPSSMHANFLTQNQMLSPSSKNFMNQNSCKMSNVNFTHTPNSEIFRSPQSLNDSSFSNRMIGDRFSNNVYSQAPMHKMSDGPLFKDIPSSNISHQLYKNDGFAESSPKLYSNMRQPLERFSCMQKDQAQFSRKYDDLPVFQGKDFPFSNKEIPPQTPVNFIDKVPATAGGNFSSCKPSFKTPSLFPAYTPKDNNEVPFQRSQTLPEETAKTMHQSAYSSDFGEKSNTYCDKNLLSSRYSKTVESFQGKTESYQERNTSINEVFPAHNSPSYLYDKSQYKPMPNSPIPQDPLKTIESTVASSNPKFPFSAGNQDVGFQSSNEMPFQKSQTMQMPNSSNAAPSRDCLMQTVPFSGSGTSVSHTCSSISSQSDVQQSSKETYSSFSVSSQPDIHQSAKDTFSSFNVASQSNVLQSTKQTLSTYDVPSQPSVHLSTKGTFSSFNVSSQPEVHQSSKETFPSFNVSSQPDVHHSSKEVFSTFTTSQSTIHQGSKETFSSFNFDSNMKTSDISDLDFAGLDAFLKETLNKSEESNKSEDTLKEPDSTSTKISVSKSSVPSCAFSDDEWSKHSIPFIGDNQSNSTQNESKEAFCDTVKDRADKIMPISEKSNDFKLPGIDDEPVTNAPAKETVQEDATFNKGTGRVTSALEEAINLLVKCDAIVGLDYIIEYKKNISQLGSFPFKCKLCNSAITRPSIIDHIIGSKHRMRYLKIKNESTYEYLVSLKVDKDEKDIKIAEAAFQMELLYGRGHVTVNTEEVQKDTGTENKPKEVTETIEEPVFTLDKIPIGFEALSPEHEEMDSSAFPLESDLNPIKKDSSLVTQREELNISPATEVKKEALPTLTSDPVLTLPGLGSDSPSSPFIPDSGAALLLSSDETSKVSVKEEAGIASFQVKRSMSPHSPSTIKMLKTESSDEEKGKLSHEVVMDQNSPKIKKGEHLAEERKEFSMDILEALSNSVISSEDEASVVLKVINMLLQMFLRYKLSHFSLEKIENLMKSLQVNSPENIEELNSLLKDHKLLSQVKENDLQDVLTTLQDSAKENAELKLSNQPEINDAKPQVTLCYASGAVQNVLNQCKPPEPSNNLSMIDQSLGSVTSTPQTSGSVAVSMAEVSKSTTVSNAASAATSLSFQSASTSGLQPPPFFSWSQTGSENNQVSYSNVHGSQNMMWNNAYQYSQAQYAQMQYYQPQNYGNSFSGTQSYASQFAVMPMNSVQMAQPPVPPLPPPPPSNPPLPPSVPLPSNLPHCMPLFANQPPPPPPP